MTRRRCTCRRAVSGSSCSSTVLRDCASGSLLFPPGRLLSLCPSWPVESQQRHALPSPASPHDKSICTQPPPRLPCADNVRSWLVYTVWLETLEQGTAVEQKEPFWGGECLFRWICKCQHSLLFLSFIFSGCFFFFFFFFWFVWFKGNMELEETCLSCKQFLQFLSSFAAPLSRFVCSTTIWYRNWLCSEIPLFSLFMVNLHGRFGFLVSFVMIMMKFTFSIANICRRNQLRVCLFTQFWFLCFQFIYFNTQVKGRLRKPPISCEIGDIVETKTKTRTFEYANAEPLEVSTENNWSSQTNTARSNPPLTWFETQDWLSWWNKNDPVLNHNVEACLGQTFNFLVLCLVCFPSSKSQHNISWGLNQAQKGKRQYLRPQWSSFIQLPDFVSDIDEQLEQIESLESVCICCFRGTKVASNRRESKMSCRCGKKGAHVCHIVCLPWQWSVVAISNISLWERRRKKEWEQFSSGKTFRLSGKRICNLHLFVGIKRNDPTSIFVPLLRGLLFASVGTCVFLVSNFPNYKCSLSVGRPLNSSAVIALSIITCLRRERAHDPRDEGKVICRIN